MKKAIFFLFCIISSFITTGQEAKNELLEVKVIPPKFIYNQAPETFTKPLYAFLHENFIYDTPELINFGTIVIRFIITEKGTILNPKVINSVDWDIDNAFIDALLQTNGMWQPGTNNGTPVAMEQEIAMMVKTGFTSQVLEKLDLKERSKVQFQKGNELLFVKDAPRRALKKFNYVVRMFPMEKNTYYLRGLCYYKLGKIDKAEKDWDYYRELGGLDFELTNL